MKVSDRVVGQIGKGMLVLLGVAKGDSQHDCDYLVRKIVEMRIFADENGKMNRSAQDVQAEFLVVSQFTLLGSCVKGRRPSFDQAAGPEQGQALYESFVNALREQGFSVATGQFRALMDVELINDGPVTFILESKKTS